MSIWPDFWSAATTFGTIAMAVTTVCTIKQGKKIIKNTERQHQDGLKPICGLVPYDHIDPLTERGNLIECIDDIIDDIGRLKVYCALKNIGSGPALNIRFRFEFTDGLKTEPWALSPLEAGASYGSPDEPLVLPIRIHLKFDKTEFQAIPGKGWVIVLDYEDVFGNKFQTVHSKQTFQRDYNRQSFVPESSGQADWGIKVHEDFIPWMSYREEKPSA